MLQIRAKILYNKKIKGNYFHLVVKAARITKESQAGQFLNIKVSDTSEPLLRRPFSIHRLKGANIEILYEVVGEATEILSQRKPGGYLDVIGPLGNGFNYRLPIIPSAVMQRGYTSGSRSHTKADATFGTNYRLPILVAGGMGVAPLLFLAEKLAYSVERIAYRKNKGVKLSAKRYLLNALVLIGAKTKNQLLCEKEFKELRCDVKVSTDDGSKGFKGKITELLKHLLSTMNYELSTIYACGPRPMLKEIAVLSRQYNIPAQVSLEEHMACGIGACLGCVVKTRQGYQRVCKEGPVFNAHEIIW